MTWDLHDFRLVTVSAYPGMMAPLTDHPSCICVLSGDADQRLAGQQLVNLSLEGLDGIRRRWRFGDVARLADFVPKMLAEAAPDGRPILLIPPRASAAWEAVAAAWPGEVRLTASPMSIVERIAEDKVHVRDELRSIGVPVPEDLVLRPADIEFVLVKAKLGSPFVLQAPSGAGGQGTYLIASQAELDAALQGQPHVDRWLLSRFAGSITMNVSGVVHTDGVHLLPASVQSSGIAELGFGFGGYCGTDFGAVVELPPDLLSQAYYHAEQVGHWLHRQGHLGLYGADIAVSDDGIAFLEVNPRIQGSSWLLSKLQQQSGQLPCLEQHVQALLGRPLLGSGLDAQPLPAPPGSHLLMRWSGPAGVVRSTPAVGVHMLPVEPPGEVTVTSMPRAGIILLPGAIMARLESDHRLVSLDGRHLLPAARSLITELQEAFDIKIS